MKNEKTLHRFTAVVAVLLTLCLVFMMPAAAEESASDWFDGGDGSDSTPYLINTKEQFANISKISTTDPVYFKLSNDIAIGEFSTANYAKVGSNQNIILNLDGHTISAKSTILSNNAIIDVLGKFTLMDGESGGSIKLSATDDGNSESWAFASVVILVSPGGDCTISGGTLQHEGGTEMAYGIDVRTNGGTNQDAKLVVNGGNIISTYSGIRLFANAVNSACIIEVNRGSISGTKLGIYLQNPNTNVNKYVATIDGGTISGGSAGAIYAETTSGSSLTIKKGDIESTSSDGTIRVETVESGYKIEISPDADISNTGDGSLIAGVNVNPVSVTVTKTGEGTESSPYLISSKKELELFAAEVNGGNSFSGEYVQLTADIDLNSEEWTPIGTKDYPFKGSFDGNGKTISNLCIKSPDGEKLGLFGVVAKSDDSSVEQFIKDVTIHNVQITGKQEIGALIGFSETGGNEITLSDCHVTGLVQITGNTQQGGLLGNTNIFKITSCSVDAEEGSFVKGKYSMETDNEKGEGDNSGGLIGLVEPNYYDDDVDEYYPITIESCSANIDVSGSRKVGGLIGAFVDGDIKDCSASGDVTIIHVEDYDVTLLSVGSLIGDVHYPHGISIVDTTATGTINIADTDSKEFVSAGFVGAVRHNSPETGHLKYNDDDYISGVATSVTNSVWNAGDISEILSYYNTISIGTLKISAGTYTTDVSNYVAEGCVCISQDAGTYVVTAKEISIKPDVTSVSFGTVQVGYEPKEAKVTLTNTGNVDTDFKVGGLSSNFIVSYDTQDTNLGLTETYTITIKPNTGLPEGTYSETLTIQVGEEESFINIPVTIMVIKSIAEEEKETTVVPELPPVAVEGTEEKTESIVVDTTDTNKVIIKPSEGENNGAEATKTVTISASSSSTSDDDEPTPSVSVVITNVKKTDDENKLELTENSEVSAEYTDVKSETSASAPVEKVSFDISIPLKTVNISTLPVFSGKYDEEIVEKIPEKDEDGKKFTPLAMFTATKNADAVTKNVKGASSITVTFYITDKLGGKFVAFHVKNGKLIGDPIDATVGEYVEGKGYPVTITVKGFSSYILAEVQDPSNGNTGGSATDTGSGNYQYYPRSVPTDGIVDFGTSKVVTGMELPAGSDGTVTLNIKPTFAMPENGFYAFEIDAPGYNLDAKINGGLSFQIPVADLEAAGWTAEDIVLFHGTVGEDGKITWEALPTNLVKNENGVAYYKAAINGCSPFYIGFVKDGSVVNTEVVDPTTPETPVTPDEPEVLPPVDEPETPEQPTESPAPILAVLAGLGAAVVLRRK